MISSFSGSGGTSALDDADFTAGASSGTPVMGVFESSPTSVTDGDVGVVGITADRALRVNVDNAGSIGGGAQFDDGDAVDTDSQGPLLMGATAVPGTARAVAVDDDGQLQVDVLSSALPTGAATAANQLPDGHNVTVDNASLAVTGEVADNDPDSGNPVKVGGRYNVTMPTYADGDRGDLQLTSRGALIAAIGSGNSNLVAALSAGDFDAGSASNFQLLPVMARDYVFNGTTWDRVRGDITNGLDVDVTRLPALPAGANNIGDVDVASIAAGANLIGDVGLRPRASGGLSIFKSIDLDESEEEVKASAGQVYSISAFNLTDAPLFLKLYDATAASVTVGTTVPVATFVVPANADLDGAGFIWNNEIGLAFSTAITAAVTTGLADNDAGAPGANACAVVIGYA